MNQISGPIANELKRTAGCYLYIFVDPKANVHPIVTQKRLKQTASLNKIARNQWVKYNADDIVRLIHQGIVERYGKTPAQLLQQIYEGATRTEIGSVPADVEAPNKYVTTTNPKIPTKLTNPVTVTVKDTKTGMIEKKSFWDDVQKVLQWLMDIIMKLFGGSAYKDVVTYSPGVTDWPSSGYGEQKTGLSMIPTLALVGLGLGLMRGKNNFINLKPQKKTSRKK